ncbi:MerR family transcriptional regulator [Azoarcus sp. KH32C]|uniref:MerR family transcriptional regulator n=1 Tax=Azoarcus sp. KH32C TaxID=748247 RepID=UPI0002386822|nr:MerR family transcriptional regulator [Azoarcus sp. KH32C]BAL23741.1 putative transcriptional regulator, MerR family [Azoarcus sp. KH32C]
MEPAKTYTFDELCTLVELPSRTVRYYIQLGLVDRPDGANRGARYATRHLEQLLTIRKWQSAGLSLERIRELLQEPQANAPPTRRRGPGTVEVWSHLVVAEGVELHVESGMSGLSPEELREFFRGVTAQYELIRGRKNQDGIEGNSND